MEINFFRMYPRSIGNKNYPYRLMNDILADRGAAVFVSFLSLAFLLLTLSESKY